MRRGCCGAANRARWLAGGAALLTVAALLLAGTGLGQSPRPGAAQEAVASLAATPAPASPPQPGFDGLRIAEGDRLVPYAVWVNLSPVLVAAPDGGAWAFFTARARRADGDGSNRLYAARFDPASDVWLPARSLPGGVVQFGPSAAIDQNGAVHLVYSERASDDAQAPATLMYTVSTDGLEWSVPVPIAPHSNAGEQVMADLTIDAKDGLHVIWRDQRNGDPQAAPGTRREGDLFLADRVGGAWSQPVQLTGPEDNVAWPHLEADVDRLIAVWSVYGERGSGEVGRRAERVVWSARPLADPEGWTAPAPVVVEEEQSEIGSLLVDLAGDPRGGVAVVSTRLPRGDRAAEASVSLLRLRPGATEWEAPVTLAAGDLGYFPTLAIGPDGTTFVAFNYGSSRRVEVGLVAVAPDAAKAGPLTVPTDGETGEHGRPALAVGADGRPWIVYMHGETNANTVELRATRGVRVDAAP